MAALTDGAGSGQPRMIAQETDAICVEREVLPVVRASRFGRALPLGSLLDAPS
ncbi:MAG TPA: hypothetical protein VGO08_06230 [Burkholderiales bacterium]|nr:hypothetical protein [Burkholderiales bacterium]